MDEHQSMTTVRALAILDIKSSKFHSVKDGYNGLNKVRKSELYIKKDYIKILIKKFMFLYILIDFMIAQYILDIISWPLVIHF